MSDLRMTPLELHVLRVAVGILGEDIDDYGLDPAEKRAYYRVLEKIKQAGREET